MRLTCDSEELIRKQIHPIYDLWTVHRSPQYRVKPITNITAQELRCNK